MSSDAAPQVRRVRFAGLSSTDGAGDAPSQPDSGPGRVQRIRTNLKRKTWRDIIPRVEYPGWPAAAFKAPPPLQWLKYFASTLAIGGIFAGITIVLFFHKPWRANRIQLHEAHLSKKLPTYAYTLWHGRQSEVWGIAPLWAVLLLALGIPNFIYIVSFLIVRSFWDLNNAFCGTNLACLSTFVMTGFLKFLIGGPRPYFVSVCQPRSDNWTTNFTGTHYVEDICSFTGVGKQDQYIAFQSFPSGHAATAFAGFTFLTLWLRARMYSRHIIHRNRERAGSNVQEDGSSGIEDDGEYKRHTHFLLSVLVILPLWAASVIALLVVRDHIHHWWDAIGGSTIGVLCALNSWNNFFKSQSGIPVLPKGWAEKVKKMEEKKLGEEKTEEERVEEGNVGEV